MTLDLPAETRRDTSQLLREILHQMGIPKGEIERAAACFEQIRGGLVIDRACLEDLPWIVERALFIQGAQAIILQVSVEEDNQSRIEVLEMGDATSHPVLSRENSILAGIYLDDLPRITKWVLLAYEARAVIVRVAHQGEDRLMIQALEVE